MNGTRRHLLASLGSLALVGTGSGCATLGSGVTGGRVALLLPLTGRHSTVGSAMAEAARLASPVDDPTLSLSIYDTGEASDALRQVATAANAGDVVIGPVFGAKVPGVLAELNPGTPLVSFTNDAKAIGPGSFSIGVTPAQSIGAVMRYARRQGVRRMAVLARPGTFGQRAARATEKLASAAGLALAGAHFADPSSGPDAIKSLVRQDRPDAVLLPAGGRDLALFARALAGSGLQVLGTSQWGGRRLDGVAGLNGAWFAAPDPGGFSQFSNLFQAQTSRPAGLLAGLAHDAVKMCRTLAIEGRLTEAGLIRTAGFDGVTGRFRLSRDGRCQRDLAILTVSSSGVSLVDRVEFA